MTTCPQYEHQPSSTTLLSNTSFSPHISVSVNTSSDSASSADTAATWSYNATYPVFLYENGTLGTVHTLRHWFYSVKWLSKSKQQANCPRETLILKNFVYPHPELIASDKNIEIC